MCSQVFLGLQMPNIHTLLLLVLHRHRFLSLSLSTRRLNVPEPTSGGESCVEVVHAIVLSLPRGHPNKTKQRFAHCYPLRAPMKAVDR